MSRVIRITLKRDSKEAPVAGNRQRPAPPSAICKSRLTRSPLIRTVPTSISSRLILRKDGPGTARWRIREGPNIGDQGRQVGVADLIQGLALGEWVRLDFKVVVIGNALDGRLGIVAAFAVLIVEMTSERLLVAEGGLLKFEFYVLMGLVGRGCDDLVAAGHAAERYVGGDLPA